MNLLQQLNNDMSNVVETVWSSLVRVSNGAHGAGAGTIWHTDGLIVTNAHVVGHGPVEVTLPNGETLPARLLARDREADLAALAVEATDLPIIELGDSRKLRPGQWVMAFGHPWGIPGALTSGPVIGMGAQLPEMPPGTHDWIALDLHLRPGHSGGPLVDVAGRLVGINTMITGPDVGFAIPVHVVKRFLKATLGTRIAIEQEPVTL